MASKRALKKLKYHTTIGKMGKYPDKNKPKRIDEFKILDEVSQISLTNPEYKHFIQKMKWADGSTSYRICYYVIGKDRKTLVFGQFCSTMSKATLKKLLKKANKKFNL